MPNFRVSLGSVIGASTDRGSSDVSGWPILTSSGKALLECPVELPQSCAPLVQGSLLFAHGFSHVWGSCSECPVFLLFHTRRPVTGTTCCLFHALPLRMLLSHHTCALHAPCMPHVSQREMFTCSALLVTRPCCSLKACSWGHVWEWLFLTKHHWI